MWGTLLELGLPAILLVLLWRVWPKTPFAPPVEPERSSTPASTDDDD